MVRTIIVFAVAAAWLGCSSSSEEKWLWKRPVASLGKLREDLPCLHGDGVAPDLLLRQRERRRDEDDARTAVQ